MRSDVFASLRHVLRTILPVIVVALALGALLVGCSNGNGGGGMLVTESLADGNCADGIDNDGDGVTDGADPDCICPDADADGACDAVDACPGTPAGCPVGADGCPLAPCSTCSEDLAGGQPDGTQCYQDSAVQQPGCGGPFRLFFYLEFAAGGVTLTVDTQDNPGGGGGQDPGIVVQGCTADCGADPLAFSCDVTDADGVTRTLSGTLDGSNIVGTIETTCGGTADFSAVTRPDAECPQAP